MNLCARIEDRGWVVSLSLREAEVPGGEAGESGLLARIGTGAEDAGLEGETSGVLEAPSRILRTGDYGKRAR
jgi:hypothetical protein